MDIIWPERYKSANTRVHVSNELRISASAETIWKWLIRATLWPDWYPTVTKVSIEGGARELFTGAKFNWRIFGITFLSRVEEFVPPERLAWSARFEGVDAYHAWLVEPKGSGCRVLTEENQNGWLARLNSLLRPSNISYYHTVWLRALEEKASSGPPAGDLPA